MSNIIDIQNLGKTYEGGFEALKNVNLKIKKGEIFALLGPNGAGKTTLISVICGLINPTSGKVIVDGFDNVKDYRASRSQVGLVPQELTTDSFETVWNTVSFSRGLFGKAPKPDYIEKILKDLSLWDKRDNKMMTLSGGMKRRVLIAKALSHEPSILFLDEPTAGVDVELRKGMWNQVTELRKLGVTIILTTHYIEEAEEMADRVGVISKGELILVEEKKQLIKKMGRKQINVELAEPLNEIPVGLKKFEVKLSEKRDSLIFTYDAKGESMKVSEFFETIKNQKISYRDISTKQSSLEEIFVSLVNQ